MIDAASQSAINTLRNWRMRREANGKPVSSPDIVARIRELWPATEQAEIETIVAGALK